MPDFKRIVIARRRLFVFGGVSILIHGVALAFFIGRSPQSPPVPEIAVEFETAPAPEPVQPEPVVEETPIAAKRPSQPSVELAGSAGVSSRRGVLKPASSASASLEAILATDFRALRADLVVPVGLAQGPARSGDGLNPVDPEIHLTDGAIDKLVKEGRGYADRRKKRGRRRGAIGMGGGSACP